LLPTRFICSTRRRVVGYERRKIRLYLNRSWQCAIVRKLLHGPIAATVPASLVRRHPDVHVTMTTK
jgi:hypothetical protein